MRTLLFFDLPVLTSNNRRDYRKFVKMVKKAGFYRLQESVFVKMSLDISAANNTINNIKKTLPPDGNIFCITITEKQFAEMQILLGESSSEILSSIDRFIEL
jgi:CRISPR-associated protein Cas2